MTFIDTIVGTALVVLIFLAFMGILRASVLVSAISKQDAVASSLAEGQLEYVRSLSYDSVGTVGGIPAGPVPQYATSTLDGITFVTHTFIDYVDDPADGLGANDTDGITTDYKRIKVTVSYMAGHLSRSVTMMSNYAPPGIETTNGGGTLKISVVDATGAGVAGASVQIVDDTTTPTVNLTTLSDSTGTVYLPGAATSTDYQVYVSKSGYSSAQTYARDSNNQNPTPGYLTVVKDQTTTGTFAIDQLASLNVTTWSPIATTTWSDSFADSSEVAVSTNVTVGGGVTLALGGGGAGYATSGELVSTTVSPTYLASWSSVTPAISAPGGTAVLVHVVDANGTLLPDAVLPGNGAGFAGTVDLSGVSTSTYPSLALRADLSTNATTTTPTLSSWTLTYLRGPVPLPNIAFTLTGAKTIGSTGGGSPIYKTVLSTSTDGSGQDPLSLEWDSYTLTLSGHDVVDACNAPPYALAPGSQSTSSLILATSTGNSLLVSVHDAGGNALSGATVTLSRAGYSQTVTTSNCGGAYFGGLTSATDYTVQGSKTGYTGDTSAGVTVSGHSFFSETL